MQPKYDLIIIGGGIAGLSASWYAEQRGFSYAVFEAGDSWGGKVHTHIMPLAGYDTPLRIEHAPDGFITRKLGMTDLVQSLGIADRLIAVNDTPQRIYVLVDGRLRALPDGLHLLAPTQIMPFLRSDLFSWWGKLRVLSDLFIPKKRDDADESLAQFIIRRLGHEALHKLGEPLLAGVYNADPYDQSMLATFPNFRKIEAEHGSLIRGLRRQTQKSADSTPALMAFRNGMGDLIHLLIERLTGELCLNTPIQHISPTDDGYAVRIGTENIGARHIIIATPAPVASALLADIAPNVSQLLGQIRYTSVGSISLAYRLSDVPMDMNAYGVVIPSTEKRRIDGITWTSAKWQHRAPHDIALIRVFFGGIHTPDMLGLADDVRLGIIQAELRSIMGISASPLAHHSAVWHGAYPQYDLAHQTRQTHIHNQLPVRIHLTGNAYAGIGLPDTVALSKKIISGLDT